MVENFSFLYSYPRVAFLQFRCEAFPTYPRTYDLVHAAGLLSLEGSKRPRCSMLDLFSEIDRLLRPEVLYKHFFPFSKPVKYDGVKNYFS